MTARICEICGVGSTGQSRAVTRVLIEERIVALCDDHLAQVERAGVERLSQLFELFPEPTGQRRAPERRSPLDRRIFPTRPEGRRRGTGRRETDSD